MTEFLTVRGCAAIAIHRTMKAVYGDDCMVVKNVRKCVRRARSCCAGEMSVLDEQRPGRHISVTRDENQCRVDAMNQENRRIKQRDITLKHRQTSGCSQIKGDVKRSKFFIGCRS